MAVSEQKCVLVLDETSITPKYAYDVSSGHLIGNTTLPGQNTVTSANHALVFMVAGKYK